MSKYKPALTAQALPPMSRTERDCRLEIIEAAIAYEQRCARRHSVLAHQFNEMFSATLRNKAVWA